MTLAIPTRRHLGIVFRISSMKGYCFEVKPTFEIDRCNNVSTQGIKGETDEDRPYEISKWMTVCWSGQMEMETCEELAHHIGDDSL